MNMYLPLHQLEVGQKGKVVMILATDHIRRRFLDLGIIPGTVIEMLYHSPFHDPTAYLIRGTVIALRKEDSAFIMIERVD